MNEQRYNAEFVRLATDLETEAETRLKYGVRSPYNDGVIAGFRSAAKSIRRVLRLIDGDGRAGE